MSIKNSTLVSSSFNFAIGVCFILLLDEITKLDSSLLDVSSNGFCFGRSPLSLELAGCKACTPFLADLGRGLNSLLLHIFLKKFTSVALATLFTSRGTGLVFMGLRSYALVTSLVSGFWDFLAVLSVVGVIVYRFNLCLSLDFFSVMVCLILPELEHML